MRRRLALLPVLALGVVACSSATPSPGVKLEPCRLAGEVAALCGRFDVPENRATPDGRRISLRVAVVPAREARSEADPIVHLTGGPGGSAIAGAAGMVSLFSDLNERRDIVLVDQRGTGGSNRLVCPVPRRRLDSEAAVTEYVRACMAALRADPRQYTTATAMDDLAEVLDALGYDEVNVYGTSYGATAAQYLLAQHPELVRTAILDGATLLDAPIFERWAPNSERALRAVLDRCAQSRRCAAAYPRVRQEAFEAVSALRRRPIRAHGLRIDAATAAGTLHALTLTADGAAEIPWIAHRARVGDWGPLTLATDRVGDGALETRQVMFWSIVCNEPWARLRPARAATASRGTYLAERWGANVRLLTTACAAVPRVPQPAWSNARVRSDTPVLLVVGRADPQDPPRNVANARRELPNSRTVVVPGAGHVAAHLGCMPRVVQRFLERGSAAGLDTSCVARYAPPRFVIP